MEHELITATWIIAISTIIAASSTAVYSHKQHNNAKDQNEILKKQIEYSAMLEIMKIFNNPRIANERFLIYNAYRNNSLYDEKGEFQGKDLAVFCASVRGTFDQMAKLVIDDYVSKEKFLDMYCEPTIRMYKVIKKSIETERMKRNSQQFSSYFEFIFNESRKYWKEKFPNDPEPEPF